MIDIEADVGSTAKDGNTAFTASIQQCDCSGGRETHLFFLLADEVSVESQASNATCAGISVYRLAGYLSGARTL